MANLQTSAPIDFQKANGRHSLHFLKNAAEFTATVGLRLGDFYQIKLPGYTIYVITAPDIIRQTMVTHGDRYEKGKIYWKHLHKTLGPALGTLEGEQWQFLRQLHSPYFSKSAIQNYLPVASQILNENIERWRRAPLETDLVELLAQLNTESILKTVFGSSAEGNAAEIAHAIDQGEDTLAWLSKYPWRPFLAHFNGKNLQKQRHLTFFQSFAKSAVEKRRNHPQKELDTLLDKLIKHYQNQGEISEEDLQIIRNEFIVYLGAGTETMAVSEAYTLYLLTKNPTVFQQIKQEINEAARGETITEKHLPQLKLTEAAVMESMRLQPSSYALLRDCVKPDEIRGQPIRQGDSIFISLYALHRNPRLWENPLQFDPSRFLNENEIPKYHYLPFGAGRHHCIGSYLALPQMTMTVAAFIQNFDIQFYKTGPLQVRSVSTLKPKGGLKARLVPKNQGLKS